MKAPLLTTLFWPVPGFGTRVKKNVPVALVAVSVEIVMEPLPVGPAASQDSLLGDVTFASRTAVTALPEPTVCVPTCAGDARAMPDDVGLTAADTMREPVATTAVLIVPVHATPSIVAVIVPGLRLEPPPPPRR